MGADNESRSAARGRVDRCPAQAAAAVSAADPTSGGWARLIEKNVIAFEPNKI